MGEGSLIGETIDTTVDRALVVGNDVVAERFAPNDNVDTSEGIESIEDSLLTLESDVVAALEVAVEEAGLSSEGAGVDGPLIAGELFLGVEADSGEEHLGPLITGEGGVGLEGGGGHAVDNALIDAEGDVLSGPVVGGDIVEGRLGAGEGLSLISTEEHVGNDLGGLLTGVGAVRIDGGGIDTVDDTETSHDTHSFNVGIANFVGIGIAIELIVSRSANYTE